MSIISIILCVIIITMFISLRDALGEQGVVEDAVGVDHPCQLCRAGGEQPLRGRRPGQVLPCYYIMYMLI